MQPNEQEATHHLYTIRDLDSKGYGLPTPAESANLFIRDLSRHAKSDDHPFRQYGSRFEIHECGSFNFQTGRIIATPPRYVGTLSDLLPKSNDERSVTSI